MKRKKPGAAKGHKIRSTGLEWRDVTQAAGVSLSVRRRVGHKDEYRLTLPGGPALVVEDTEGKNAQCVTYSVATMQRMAVRLVALQQKAEAEQAAALDAAYGSGAGELGTKGLNGAVTSAADFASPASAARAEDSQGTMPSELEVGVPGTDKRLVDEQGRPL